MALNAASHNSSNYWPPRGTCPVSDVFHIAGEKTGPVSGPPPSASQETTAALLGAAKDDPMGQHEGGHDRGDKEAPQKMKSEKERTCPG